MKISCFQSFGGGSNLNNLAKLMSNDSSASRLRSIVVSKTKKATFVPGLPKDVAIKGEQISFLSPELGFSLLRTADATTTFISTSWDALSS